jgi:hypothetical protein
MKRRTSFEDVKAVDELLHQPSVASQRENGHVREDGIAGHPSAVSIPSRLAKRGRLIDGVAAEDMTVLGESPFLSRSSYEVQRSKITTVSKLAEGLTAIQEHENELAEVVVVCEPEQASLMMGGLHPRGSLFERPVNIEVAKMQHTQFREVVSMPRSSPYSCWIGQKPVDFSPPLHPILSSAARASR